MGNSVESSLTFLSAKPPSEVETCLGWAKVSIVPSRFKVMISARSLNKRVSVQSDLHTFRL